MSNRYQMSDSIRLGIFLTLSGGFQDAYSYICRDKVFVNAQTGNIVLLAQNIADSHYETALRYLIPLIAFTCGSYLSQRMKLLSDNKKSLHWRQKILLTEMFFLFLSGLLPDRYNMLANSLLSFVCAMQVTAFRKFHYNSYATTMCIGNLRSATTLLCKYHITKERSLLQDSIHYFLIIFIFFVGAGLGTVFARYLHLRSIWVPILFLGVAFFLMFREEVHQRESAIKSEI